MLKGSCLIGQSGGPTSVINASLAGIVKTAQQIINITKIYGALHGIDGVINKQIIDLSSLDNQTITGLMTTPGAALGSVRLKLPNFLNDEQLFKQIFEVFKCYDIRYFFYIGGNDSMDTCHKINDYLKYQKYDCHVIGIPKTIDNDLTNTNSSPGFGSSAKYVANAITNICVDLASYEKGKVTIIEVMGRDAGWLTAAAKLACQNGYGPDYIYVPEVPFNISTFLNDVSTVYHLKKRAILVVSEGLKDENKKYIAEAKNHDHFGHIQLGGVSYYLANLVHEKLDLPVRAIELNLVQRSMSNLLSAADVDFAYQAGVFAVKQALQGHNGCMVSQREDLTLTLVPLVDVANKTRFLPLKYVNSAGNNINENYLAYLLPLVKGNVILPTKNEIPLFVTLEKEIVIK